MNILYLGKRDTRIFYFLKSKKYNILQTENKISNVLPKYIDYIISYNYRYIIPFIIAKYETCINLHTSYLPFNRGAHPNFWSWYDNTEKGVTIHYVDERLDTGNIIIQKKISLSNELTLSESYNILQSEIQILFMDNWDNLFNIPSVKQGVGTYHHSSQLKKYLLIDEWNTSCKYIEDIGKVERAYQHRNYLHDNL